MAPREPITNCASTDANGTITTTCTSGSPDCQQSLCGYLDDDGKLYPNGTVVTETKNVALLMIGECSTPMAVAVGGGGTTQYDCGSGSGYVEFTELDLGGSYGWYTAVIGGSQGRNSIALKVSQKRLRKWPRNGILKKDICPN